jgi:hypothetical protein
MLLRMVKKGDAIYGNFLQSFPMPKLPFKTHTNDKALEELYTNHPFNWLLNLALYYIGDVGVIADVH